MYKLSIADIIGKIQQGAIFEAVAEDGSFVIKIDRYVPYVCTAIHDGHRMRETLVNKCALDDYERWYEEDPLTGDFISSMPITLIGRDSRFEYDLNRSPENAIYTEAWGKKVWKRALTKTEKEISLKKHRNYYQVTHALIAELEKQFDGCIVYDMHSYNYKRWERDVPLFNIGSENVDPKYNQYVDHWLDELKNIEMEGNGHYSAINDVFYGRGYNLEYITRNFTKTLVLATEVKKVYCDEETGETYPKVVRQIKGQLKQAILSNANYFLGEQTNWKYKKTNSLLTKNLEKITSKVDRQLFNLVKDFELLNFVNPTNIDQEKKKFFKSHFTENPQFEYRPVDVDPFEMKRKLHNLEVDKINDISIENMYEATINGYIDKIDMLASLGTDKFLYNSLRYFGEPSKDDIHNANYILHLPDVEEEQRITKTYGVKDAIKIFKESFKDYGFTGKIAVTRSIVSDVMVLNRQKKVLIRHGLRLHPKELRYLVHHEIGVHMVTTMNSNLQPLKIMNVGLPVNTCTQEGLAVLAEYLSGNITLKRLRKLAYRVIAIDRMCNGADFKSTFKYITEEFDLPHEEAFTLVTRVYRGGGYTKDFLYLRGFSEMYNFWKSDKDLSPLLLGKTSTEYYNTIVEMMDRGMLVKPAYITRPFANPQTEANNPIFDFIVSGIK